MSIVKPAQTGNAFDVNIPLSTSEAVAFKNAGYSTCIRYLPRTPSLMKGNLTGVEIEAILASGLSISAVQHVAMPGWVPNATIGEGYGSYAAEYAEQIRLPKGMTLWLDLEEVASTASDNDVISYCNSWFSAVEKVGYLSGLYVGWNIKLTSPQLYDLATKSYWKAYNADIDVSTRGYQILQHTQKTLNGITFDPNIIVADKLGDLPFVLSPS